jgi:hypothetical protein
MRRDGVEERRERRRARGGKTMSEEKVGPRQV